jgi:hypothetical protein
MPSRVGCGAAAIDEIEQLSKEGLRFARAGYLRARGCFFEKKLRLSKKRLISLRSLT